MAEEKKSENTIQDAYALAITKMNKSDSHRMNPGPYGRTEVKPEDNKVEKLDE